MGANMTNKEWIMFAAIITAFILISVALTKTRAIDINLTNHVNIEHFKASDDQHVYSYFYKNKYYLCFNEIEIISETYSDMQTYCTEAKRVRLSRVTNTKETMTILGDRKEIYDYYCCVNNSGTIECPCEKEP